MYMCTLSADMVDLEYCIFTNIPGGSRVDGWAYTLKTHICCLVVNMIG